jgi:hypothetical protein
VRLALEDLTEGAVVIKAAFSSVNYKDAFAATGAGKIMRRFPLVGGIDVSGTVVSSSDARFTAGDLVLVTGYDLGETHDGGYAEYVRVPADWVVPVPPGLTLSDAMAIGTAGFTAALSVVAGAGQRRCDRDRRDGRRRQPRRAGAVGARPREGHVGRRRRCRPHAPPARERALSGRWGRSLMGSHQALRILVIRFRSPAGSCSRQAARNHWRGGHPCSGREASAQTGCPVAVDCRSAKPVHPRIRRHRPQHCVPCATTNPQAWGCASIVVIDLKRNKGDDLSTAAPSLG